MSSAYSAYDSFLDKCVDEYYSDDEEETEVDEEWKIDRYIEDQERESFDE